MVVRSRAATAVAATTLALVVARVRIGARDATPERTSRLDRTDCGAAAVARRPGRARDRLGAGRRSRAPRGGLRAAVARRELRVLTRRQPFRPPAPLPGSGDDGRRRQPALGRARVGRLRLSRLAPDGVDVARWPDVDAPPDRRHRVHVPGRDGGRVGRRHRRRRQVRLVAARLDVGRRNRLGSASGRNARRRGRGADDGRDRDAGRRLRRRRVRGAGAARPPRAVLAIRRRCRLGAGAGRPAGLRRRRGPRDRETRRRIRRDRRHRQRPGDHRLRRVDVAGRADLDADRRSGAAVGASRRARERAVRRARRRRLRPDRGRGARVDLARRSVLDARAGRGIAPVPRQDPHDRRDRRRGPADRRRQLRRPAAWHRDVVGLGGRPALAEGQHRADPAAGRALRGRRRRDRASCRSGRSARRTTTSRPSS